MGDLFVYILKSSICLAVFYLFFKLMLCRETFHKFNRIVLLSLFIVSFIIPFIDVTLHKATPYTGLALDIDAILAMAQSTGMTADNAGGQNIWLIVLFIIYILGVAASVINAVCSFVKMLSLIRSKEAQRVMVENKIVLIIHKKEIAPFSWMRYIVISESDYNDSGREIITHEKAHISKYHSLDLLLAEVVEILHWFNPAAYLLKQELQNIHEFQADQAVINNGIDAKQYQLLLIKKAVGVRLYTMANSFNHSKLKNRIAMISKKKSTRTAALKVLFVLPLTAFAIVAFASEEVTSKIEVISNANKTDTKGTREMQQHFTITIDPEDTSKIAKEKGEVTGSQKKDGVRIVSITRSSAKQGDSVKTCVIVSKDMENGPMVIINGKEANLEIFNAINPEAIESIFVLKDKASIDQYGDKGKNGVLLISLKRGETLKNTESKTITISVKNEGFQPLYVVDGIIKENFNRESLESDNIKSMSVLKGDVATKKYGDKGKNGVIEITLKNGEKSK